MTTEYGRKHTDGSRSGGQPVIAHQRGCAGRDYTCTCGYEDARDSRLKAGDAALRMTAAACADHVNTIIQLRREIADFRQEVSDVVQDYADHVNGGHEWKKLMALIIPKPKPDPMPMDTALISAYKQGFADGAEEQRCCFADETPHKDCINEGFQNWLANNPSIRAALEARGLEIRSKNDD